MIDSWIRDKRDWEEVHRQADRWMPCAPVSQFHSLAWSRTGEGTTSANLGSFCEWDYREEFPVWPLSWWKGCGPREDALGHRGLLSRRTLTWRWMRTGPWTWAWTNSGRGKDAARSWRPWSPCPPSRQWWAAGASSWVRGTAGTCLWTTPRWSPAGWTRTSPKRSPYVPSWIPTPTRLVHQAGATEGKSPGCTP